MGVSVAESQGQSPRRRGSRATRLQSRTEAEVNTARRAADAPVPEATRAVNAAIDRLGRVRPDARFRINADCGCGRQADDLGRGRIAVRRRTARRLRSRWDGRYQATAGSTSTTARVTLKPANARSSRRCRCRRRGGRDQHPGAPHGAPRAARIRSRTCCGSRPHRRACTAPLQARRHDGQSRAARG